MEIPHNELQCPLRLVTTDVREVPRTAKTVAVYGKAKQLSALKALNELNYLWISGVNDAAAHLVGQLAGLERLVIHDLRIPDLQPLVGLVRLRTLAVAGSAKLRSLAGLEALTTVRSLVLFDSCNYTDLEPIGALEALERLCLEGGFSKRLQVATLAPLGRLRRLQQLRLASLSVADKSLTPLHGLRDLSRVFIAKAFSPEEFQALAASLPNAHGEWLDSYRTDS